MADPYEAQQFAGQPREPVNEPPRNPAHDAPELIPQHPTSQLEQWRNALRSHIPSDPSFAAAAGAVLRALLDREISHPTRADRDQQQATEQQKAADEIERRQGHVPGPPAPHEIERRAGRDQPANPIDARDPDARDPDAGARPDPTAYDERANARA